MPRLGRIMKRILPRSLFGRAFIIIVVPVALTLIVATYLFYERHWDRVTQRLAQGLGGDVAMVIQLLEVMTEPDEQAFVLNQAMRRMHLQVTLLPGARLPEGPSRIARGIRDRTLVRVLDESLSHPYHLDTLSSEEWLEIQVRLDEGVLRVVASRSRVESSSTYIFIMWIMGTGLVLVVIALIFMRNQLRPIRRLAEAADAFGKGRDVKAFRPGGATEVRRAAAAFLGMRERIERQISQRTEMLAGVSHDLRTPLTRMKLQIAMLGEGEKAASLASEVAEMEQMVDGYLAFARGQEGEPTVVTDLSAMLGEVASEARLQGDDVAFSADGEIMVPIRPGALKRCITNLVDNARSYAERVWISVRRADDIVEIIVDDDGPGIPEDQWEAVFKPFHRLDSSRNPDTGGSGLGMSIARDVARGHGGDIVLSVAPNGGLRACVRLPV